MRQREIQPSSSLFAQLGKPFRKDWMGSLAELTATRLSLATISQPKLAAPPGQEHRQRDLGSGLIDQSQKMMVAASAMADMKVCAQRS